MKHTFLATLAAVLVVGPGSHAAEAQDVPIDCAVISDGFTVTCESVETGDEPAVPDDTDTDTGTGTFIAGPDSHLGLPSSTGIRLPDDYCAPASGSGHVEFIPEVIRIRTRTINTLEAALTLGLDPTGTYRIDTYSCVNTPGGVAHSTITVTVVLTAPTDIQSWISTAIARVSAQIPSPAIGVNPVDHGIVNIQTWYAITNTWEPVRDSDRLGYLNLALIATPTQTVFTSNDTNDPYGNVDNSPVICTDAGDTFEPGDDPEEIQDCAHTFTYPSAWDNDDGFVITADTSWTINWSIAGTLLGGNVNLARRSTHTYEVREVQTIGGTAD